MIEIFNLDNARAILYMKDNFPPAILTNTGEEIQMTKAEVANKVIEKTGLSRKQATIAVEAFLSSIKDALRKGEKISLVGFGTFIVKHKNARNGRNPRTGEKIHIPEKKTAYFKPGKAFRETVNR